MYPEIFTDEMKCLVSYKIIQGQEVIKQDWLWIGNCWNQMEGSWEFILLFSLIFVCIWNFPEEKVFKVLSTLNKKSLFYPPPTLYEIETEYLGLSIKRFYISFYSASPHRYLSLRIKPGWCFRVFLFWKNQMCSKKVTLLLD